MSQINAEASDYRSSQMENPINKNYSTALTQQKFPSKKQAIVFTSIDGAKLQDYLIPLGELIHPKNILFCSRLSNNRICMYLSSEAVVEKFMNSNGGTIEVNKEIIHARRYVTPSERLVLSNVCPSIPNNILVEELKNIGLEVLSPMTFLKISASLPEFSHILSFRRQIYITPTNITIPDSLLINYDNTSYRIFLSQDNMICYNCKQSGHTAAKCQSISSIAHSLDITTSITTSSPSLLQNNSTNNLPSLSLTRPLTSVSSSHSTSTSPIIAKDLTPVPTESDPSQNNSKRTIDDTLTPPTPTGEKKTLQFAKPIIPNPKKKKSELTTPSETTLEDFIQQHNPPFILDFTQLTDLLHNVKGSPDPISIVKDYTENFTALIDMLTQIYPYMSERALKTRSTKLRKSILKHLRIQTPHDLTSDTDSDCSQPNH